ncbi:MAG: hypothetical protein J6M92_06680 [Oribacterium sp.]|nr:hypothetical protein [Oribacterium sp.]
MNINKILLIIFIVLMSTCGASANYVDKKHTSVNASAAGFELEEDAATISQIPLENTGETDVEKTVCIATASEI